MQKRKFSMCEWHYINAGMLKYHIKQQTMIITNTRRIKSVITSTFALTIVTLSPLRLSAGSD